MKLLFAVQPLWAINKTPSELNDNPKNSWFTLDENPFAQNILLLLEIDVNAIYGILLYIAVDKPCRR